METLNFDVIILGGGHAGIEAAWAASEFDISVAIVTMPGVPIGSTPCNPSIGGVGKGQVVREIDALGGIMGRIADKAGIQFRTLNESKGYAVQSTRAQVDKDLYAIEAEKILAEKENLYVHKVKIDEIKVRDDQYILFGDDVCFACKKLVVTTGTFLGGKLHCGQEQSIGGRFETEASNGLSDLMSGVQTLAVRFKTGTPPRVDKKTLDFSKLEEQESDLNSVSFHCMNNEEYRGANQVSCWLSRTNEEMLDIIRSNKERSPMYNGQITGVGPRYCPSIEDKAFRYPDRNVHHVFIEPEGLSTDSIYPNGISTSLPREIQLEFIRKIPGMEKAEIMVHGYAVEYDVVDTSYLSQTLEHEDNKGLYFAGQVNGTSGYEEAAGQGIIAGFNAALSIFSDKTMVLSRNDSYIGVMVEDLVSNKRDEPYRLFTARAENRLAIRDDNAVIRMASYRKELNLRRSIDYFIDSFIFEYNMVFDLVKQNKLSKKHEDYKKFQNLSLIEILQRPEIDPVEYLMFYVEQIGLKINKRVIRNVAIDAKYDGYIKRSRKSIAKVEKQDNRKIDYKRLLESPNISFECKKRIKELRPKTFSQLKRIDGIRPATLVYVANNIL